MKLASLKHGRDGKLIIVNTPLTQAVEATAIAPTLQAALDDWRNTKPKLEALSKELNAGSAKGAFAFDPAKVHSPLPRAYQWVDSSAYVTHVELVRKARGAEMPPSFWTDPLMYQGCSDAFLAPTDPIAMADVSWGIDLEAEVAIVTDDVPMGITPKDAANHIQLILLVNDVSLRNLIPNELAKGFGFFQSKPASAFSPVAVTPEELGSAWKDGKIHLPLVTHLNGALFGKPNAGVDMTFDFPTLIAHAAKTRHLCAGTIIGSGTVSNQNHAEVGSSCLAEKRMLETIEHGAPKTPFLQYGDTVRIEMLDTQGKSIFGAIDQKVVPYAYKEKAA
jgi:fumarylacetoacetate (FAA) hydrolase